MSSEIIVQYRFGAMSLYFWAQNKTDSNFVYLNYVLKSHDVLVNSLLLASAEYDFINTKYKHSFSLRL